MTRGRQFAMEARLVINSSMRGFLNYFLVSRRARNALMTLLFPIVSQAEMSWKEASERILLTHIHHDGAEAVIGKWLSDCRKHRIKEPRLKKKTRERLHWNIAGTLARLDPHKVKNLTLAWSPASSN